MREMKLSPSIFAADLGELKSQIKELEDKIQKLTDKYIKDVDAAVEAKGKEIMTV